MVMNAHISTHHVESDETKQLEKFAIDFSQVGTMVKKLDKSFETIDQFKQSIDSLLDLLKQEYKSSSRTFSNALMTWRSMLIIL